MKRTIDWFGLFVVAIAFGVGCGSSGKSSAGAGGSAAAGAVGGASTTGGGGAVNGSGGTIFGTGGGSGGSTASGGAAVAGSGSDSVYQPPPPITIDYSGKTGFSQSEDTCNGVDDDSNGIVDDVDVNHDGVCDCLKIATIGRAGVWGTSTLFAQWLAARGASAAVDLGDQVLTAGLLAPYEVIVILDASTVSIRMQGTNYPVSHVYSAAEATALGDWVKAGGGVMTTIGYTSQESSEVANVNTLLAFSGMAYSATLTAPNGDVTLFDPHPVTSGVLKLAIEKGWPPAAGPGQTVGWDAQNRVALRVGTSGNGRIVMWGDEWITYDAYWASRPDLDIELFWLNVIKWLTPPKQCQVPIPPIVH